jgi:hypothetical protein
MGELAGMLTVFWWSVVSFWYIGKVNMTRLSYVIGHDGNMGEGMKGDSLRHIYG